MGVAMHSFTTMIRAGLPLGAAVLACAPQPAQAEDASVARRLTERGYKYDIDKDGDYRVVYKYESERRTQLAYVSGRTKTAYGVPIRKVFSPAAVLSKNRIDGALALELLDDAFTNKMGGWGIAGGVLYLAIKLPDSASALDLQGAMIIAAELADNMEITISGAKDEL